MVRIHQEASPASVQQATLELCAKSVRFRFRLDLFIVYCAVTYTRDSS